MAGSTYRSWLAEQEKREDQVGWYARWWTKTSPGRISSVQGIEKFIKTAIEDIGKNGEGDGGISLEHARAALEYHALAVEEYHGRNGSRAASGHPGAAQEAQGPDGPSGSATDDLAAFRGDPTVAPLQFLAPNEASAAALRVPGHVGAGAVPPVYVQSPLGNLVSSTGPGNDTPARAGRYTGWPQERFDRLEAKVDRLIEIMTALLAGWATDTATVLQGELQQFEHPLDSEGWSRLLAAHPEAAAAAPWDALAAWASDTEES